MNIELKCGCAPSNYTNIFTLLIWIAMTRGAVAGSRSISEQAAAMHALIIEDEAFVACEIEDALRDIGFTTFDFAGSANEAVGAAHLHHPDLITSDMSLYRSTGADAVETITAFVTVPVVFVTAVAGEVRRRFPFATVVQKPFRPAELIDAVADVRVR